MKLKSKYYYNFENLFFYILIFLLFFPKIDLIPIPGYWQGIRLEDILLLVYALVLVLNYDEKIINNNNIKSFYIVFAYFLYLFFSSFIGKISNAPIHNIILIRILEYFLAVILICNLNTQNKNILNFIIAYLFLNLVIIILQKFDLFGSFSSLGYLEPSHFLNERTIGLTGGSWELGIIFSLCYFILIRFGKYSLKFKAILFLFVLLINIISENRMNAIGFILANIILFKNHLNLRNYLYLLFSLLFFSALIFFNLKFLDNDSLNRLTGTNYIDALLLVRDFFVFLELPLIDDLDTSLWSLWYRLSLWSKLIVHYLDNFYTIVFGAGVYRIYFESTILRIIFTSGLVGLIFIIYNVRKLELYMLVYFVVVGITLDVFNSFKIFCFTILYYRLLYENYSNRRD